MKTRVCDICGKEALHHKIDVCHGFTTKTEGRDGTFNYKPFEKNLKVSKKDLCEKHFKDWCKATYTAFWKIPEEYE